MSASDIKAVSVPVILSGASLRADGSAGIRLQTQLEAPMELMDWLNRHHLAHLNALLTEDPQADALAFKGAVDSAGKTSSQKLRNALFRIHHTLETYGRTKVEFELWYQRAMSWILNQVEHGNMLDDFDD